jgi:CubicO group peptidase (beta-lactamase class C family)
MMTPNQDPYTMPRDGAAANPLPIATPESVGLSSQAILACIQELETCGTEMHSFMVYRHGRLVAETWWSPYARTIPHTCHSLGKSYTAAAIGIAVREGLVRVDERIVDIFADEIKAFQIKPDENMAKLRVHHVLAMSNGQARMPAFNEQWLYNFLSSPFVYEPGTHFLYNTLGACLLGVIVEKCSGIGLKEYLKPRLFDKIGIDSDRFIWLKFHDGHYAEPGTCATTEDNLRLAILYMNGGRWNGEQILDEDWARAAMTCQTDSSEDPGIPDCRCGYGYQLWMCSVPGVVRFDGGQGQLCIISKEKDLIVAIHEGATAPVGLQTPLDVVYKHLFRGSLPDRLPENEATQQELTDYLATRTIPGAPACRPSAGASRFGGRWNIVSGDPNIWIEVGPTGLNFFDLFYSYSCPWQAETLDIDLRDTGCRLVWNDYAVLQASCDGRYHVVDTKNVLPLEKTVSQVIRADDRELSVNLRWLNGWFIMKISLLLAEDGQSMQIEVAKGTLNEQTPYKYLRGEAIRA